MRMWLGPSRTMPTPVPFGLEESSTYSVHWSSSGVCCRSLTKSSRHWALIGPCGSHRMLNLESSIA